MIPKLMKKLVRIFLIVWKYDFLREAAANEKLHASSVHRGQAIAQALLIHERWEYQFDQIHYGPGAQNNKNQTGNGI